MSVPAKLNDASIVQKFELSVKEKALKSKLFGKKATVKPPTPTKTTRGATKSSTVGSLENNNPNLPNQTINGTVYKPVIEPSNEQIEKFLSNMESEFRDLNKKQVTMGMLNSQHLILKDHTEILNDNQRNITQLLNFKMKEQENSKKGSSSENVEAQREMLKEMIAPINSQIAEIRQLYEVTRSKAEAAAREVANTRSSANLAQQFNEQEMLEINSKMKDYQSSSSDLKEKALTAQARLSNLLPENLHAVKQISNLNIQAYSDCINSLKKQLEHLQKDADKAERELETRYQKLNSMPKPTPKLKPNDPFYHVVEHGHEGSADIVKNLQNIDFQASKKTVLTKLGGEFDYEGFIDDVNSVSNEIRDIRSALESDLIPYSIIIPSDIGLSEEEKLAMDLGTQIPSVIDEIKARYRIPKRMPVPQQFPDLSEARSQPRSQVIQEEPQLTQSSQRDNIQPLFGVKSKRLHQKPEALVNIKTRPIEPPPDVKFTKVEVRQQSGAKANYAGTIFSTDQPAKRQQQKEIHVRGSPGGSDFGAEEEQEETKQNFQQAPANAERTTQTGFRTNTNQERNEREPSQRTLQNPLRSQKVRFDELDEDHDPAKVLISSAKKDERYQLTSEFHYQRPEERTRDQIYDDYIDRTILRDIKEEIVRINTKIKEEEKQEYELQGGKDRGQAQRSASKDTRSRDNDAVFFGQKFDLRPTAVLGDGIASSEIPGRLGLHEEHALNLDDEQLIKKISSSVLNEKLREIVAEEKKKDENYKDDIFKPVEGISVRELLKNKTQDREDRSRVQGTQNLGDNKELSNLLAENMLNLFTNAIQHINTSLVKNLAVTQARDQSPHKSIHELFGRKKETTVGISDTRNKVTIEEEEVRGVRRGKREDQFAREDETTLSKLALESKRTEEERNLLRQHKPFNVEYFAEKPRERLTIPSSADGFYFYDHEPRPIANYSDYCKELESENSSVGVETIRSANRPGHSRLEWDTGSEGYYRSEGYSGAEDF